ncbi:HYKK [Bugula neritina]|uniref:Hydroxylysine kinase n=1 Tax=Bugula neritina TaxID=10212 RepID=A0A7J7ITA7_BUGNE|nr:HYKK [Bugula neritina]
MAMGCPPQKPDLPDSKVSQILSDYFGCSLIDAKRLDGYDDFSAHVTFTKQDSSGKTVQHGVIKILGADNSVKHEFQKFIGGFLEHLCNAGLPFSRPLRLSNGTLNPPTIQLEHSEQEACQGHYVHLLSYVEGVPLSMLDFHYDGYFLQKIGSLAARMHSVALTHPTHIPERVKSPWYLVDAELLLDKICAVNLSAEDVSLSLRAVKDFTSCLGRHKYTESILHGDLKGDNIIMKVDEGTKPSLSGVIDFADLVKGPVVIDIAVFAVAVWIVNWPPTQSLLQIISEVLAGYTKTSDALPLTAVDRELLYHAIPARCVQHLVMCRYDALHDPDNVSYLLSEDVYMLGALREFYETCGKDSDLFILLHKHTTYS